MNLEENGQKILLFQEMDHHLLEDEQPSLYFQALQSPVFETEQPFTMLSQLKHVEQDLKHHPEGNVWNHTMLVLDEAAARKAQAGDARVFMWAALLHDIGKAATTKLRKGRITAYDHDKAGAEMARAFLTPFAGEPFVSKVTALVRWHMQILYVTRGLPFARTAEMRREADVHKVALLGLCDRLGRLNADRRKEERTIREFKRKVEANGKQ